MKNNFWKNLNWSHSHLDITPQNVLISIIFPIDSAVKEIILQCRNRIRMGAVLRSRKIPWRRKWQPTPVFLSRKSQGQRSLAGYSLWGCKESDMTEVTWGSLYTKINTSINSIAFLLLITKLLLLAYIWRKP